MAASTGDVGHAAPRRDRRGGKAGDFGRRPAPSSQPRGRATREPAHFRDLRARSHAVGGCALPACRPVRVRGVNRNASLHLIEPLHGRRRWSGRRETTLGKDVRLKNKRQKQTAEDRANFHDEIASFVSW